MLRLGLAGLVAAPGVESLASTHWIGVDRLTLELPRWDRDGFKIALIGDLHINRDVDVRLARRAVEAAMAESPDAVVFIGDYVTMGEAAGPDLLAAAFQPLALAVCPLLAVLGNHDVAVGRDRVAEALRLSRIQVLRNEAAQVDGVNFIGFDDALFGYPDYAGFERYADGRSNVVLLHEPDYVDYVPVWASLQLSGHSHGGQIRFPGGVALLTPVGARRYVDGFYPEASVPVFVTRGVGTRQFRFRAFCRPQVAILTLVRRSGPRTSE
ncbi:MAG: metallophosphoesterase [Fimbriimonadaceae bacterium]